MVFSFAPYIFHGKGPVFDVLLPVLDHYALAGLDLLKRVFILGVEVLGQQVVVQVYLLHERRLVLHQVGEVLHN